MSAAATASVVETLRECCLLDATQLEQVATGLEEQYPTPQGLTAELVRRGWLTPFQRQWLLEGKGCNLVLGPYVLLERLGCGGMGDVFKARHPILNRLVALKVARKDASTDPTDERRFLREIQATAQLCHPNIVTAHDAIRVDGAHVLVMEYVEGTDLGRVLRECTGLPIPQACDYVRQAALGLQHAHERGFVHRDIKPSNLLLTADHAVVKISDLGLVRRGTDEDGHLTLTGMVVGTPDYLAPEQAMDARAVDIRADLYSLGCTLYHCLAGRPPFGNNSMLEKLFKHVEEQAPPVETLRPDVPPPLAAIVSRLLAKKPADRFQTPAELVQALEPFCGPPADVPAAPPPAPAVTPPPESHEALSALRQTVIEALRQPEPAASAEAETPGAAPAGPAAAAAPAAPQASAAAPEQRRAWLTRRRLGVVAGVAVVVGVGVFYGYRWAGWGKPQRRPPVTNPAGMEFAWIPAGTFTMGSPPGEPGRRDDEGPAHAVTISQPFYLAVHETTVGQFRAFVQSTHYQTGAEKDGAGALRWNNDKGDWETCSTCTWRNPGWTPDDAEPVVCVSRNDALAFCYWLSRKEGKNYRLPTEAEWEYACRAGTATAFATGPVLTAADAQLAINPASPERAARAGSFAPNAWGLYDMHGNAWEWCADLYRPTAYSEGSARDPRGPQQGDLGVLRGGSWRSPSGDCRSAARLGVALGCRRSDTGFRVVLESGVR